jgi:hypothetical protein
MLALGDVAAGIRCRLPTERRRAMSDDPRATEQCRAWSTRALRDYQEFLNEMESLFKSGTPFVATPASLEIETQTQKD